MDKIENIYRCFVDYTSYKQTDVDFREYWEPIFGNPIFRATMGKTNLLLYYDS